MISYEFPPCLGGVARYAFYLSKTISDMGHNVNVIASDHCGRINLDEKNLSVRYLNAIKKSPLRLFSFNILTKKEIINLHKKENFDIIHQIHDYYSIAIDKEEIQKPIIATIHHPFTAERKFFKMNNNFFGYYSYLFKRRALFLEKMQKSVCEKADKIIAVSNYTAKNIAEEYDVPRRKMEVIPNGVDINRFNPKINGKETKERLGIKHDPVILFVGILNFHKGVEYLIKSFSKVIRAVPNAKLVIAGDGPQRDYIIKLIDNLNLKKSVKMIGKVRDDDLLRVYAASDVLVLPSLMEGFGMVLIEAMACGKPCVASRAGGVEDVIVDGETGFIVPPADSDSLYQAIHDILIDDMLSKKFGVAGRKRVEENFTWDHIARRTLGVYEKML
jgi:N-acetyl-alpha-D-glucosaminyl L-malate synthase BshA